LEASPCQPSNCTPDDCGDGPDDSGFYQVHALGASGLPFTFSTAIQPTDNKVIIAPIISVSVAVSMTPLATSVPPMNVSRWRSSAMMADCIRLGLLGLRRNSPIVGNVICFAVLQILCSQQRIERPIRGRNALRKAWAKRCRRPRNRDKRLGIVCQSKPSHPVLRGQRPCQAVAWMRATCQQLLGWGMRTCGRWPLLKACYGCKFSVA